VDGRPFPDEDGLGGGGDDGLTDGRGFDQVTIRVSDREASERFYDAVLRTLGVETNSSEHYAAWDDFSLAQATAEEPVTRRLHVGFGARQPLTAAVPPERAHGELLGQLITASRVYRGH
jgi:catechol 2,3-dioxygenase-like lactoylglutathione lyase family enzyme